MNQAEIGIFIANCRKEKKLTQAQLAEKLNITDRAVSKWETGKSMPDSSIMLELCEILGITVNELLRGEKDGVESDEKRADKNLIAAKRKGKKCLPKNGLVSLVFSAMLLSGIVVCLICDMAASGHLTWSLIPVSSIVFMWILCFPIIFRGKQGVILSLIFLSIFIFPYFSFLSNVIKVKEVFSVGAMVAIPSIIFLWIIAAIFCTIGKKKKLAALGITFILAIPLLFTINVILSKMINEPIVDVWDLLSVFLFLLLAFVSFLYGYAKKKGGMQ